MAYDISEPKTLKRELNAFNYFDVSDDKSEKQQRRLISYGENKKSNEVEIVAVDTFMLAGK